MLTPSFYKSFAQYDYILVYQLDAFVFCDELSFWCNKDYDYIGAPIIGHYRDRELSFNMRVGNGGLSLRKISSFLNFFQSNKNVFSPKECATVINLKAKPYTRVIVWILMVLGWRNKAKIVSKRWYYNEDDFWSGLLDKSNFAMKKPPLEEAMFFSFERFPSVLFKLTGNKLPFGCHAWRKYEYDDFWSKYIY